jgi:dipeptidase
MKRLLCALAVACLVAAAAVSSARACTSILVGREASTDGSVMITYACDGEFHPRLRYTPAADHEPDAVYEIRTWRGELLGTIPQPEHTYAVVGLMNEHQLVIGETTFTGREELENPDGLLHYWTLMQLALQRARTAREAIEVITGLVAEHGYRSTGETFSIADPEEAWLLEMIGPGPGGAGAHWVARRVPDDKISVHANRSRIGRFPLDDPANCLYSEDVIEFAIERGYYDPESGEPFRFNEAYHPATAQSMRYTATRVWSVLRRVAPSLELDPAFHRGDPGAERYPLFVEPEQELGVADVMALMRDHYEGTPYDMTEGIDAGPFGTPNRWRPMAFEVDKKTYTWERPISTQQTGFSFVSQSRRELPDPIGGVLWYGVDDTYTSVYIPLYAGVRDVPPAYARGSLQAFSWDSAWWVFNFVSNIANLKYSYMAPEILAVQRELEEHFLALQPAVEATARRLLERDPELMHRYLTDYCTMHGEQVVTRWRALGEHLLTKYNDGYVKDEDGRPQEVGYPESWLRRVLRERPEPFLLPDQQEEAETDLPY